MFTDDEVEQVSPSKPRGAAAAAASAGSMADQSRLLSILEQQRGNLAALQDKKRRLETAQEEVRGGF